MLAVVAPGQGAQTPGFLLPWLDHPDFRRRFEALSQVSGIDLVNAGTEADADQIRATDVAQPLLVATGIATSHVLFPGGFSAGAVTGHSVGEITAAAIAGVLTDDDAMTLVRERGKAMAQAAAATPTGMTAVLGGARDDVLATLERHGLTPANDNGAGQIVAGGTLEQLAALADDGPARARLAPLSVAGAFHTAHMAPAVEHVSGVAAGITPADPTLPVLSNADGRAVADGADALARIVGQIANPVRWDLTMEALLASGVTGMLELPPAGTLTGIARRGMKGVATFALKTPDQLDEAAAFCAEHDGSN